MVLKKKHLFQPITDENGKEIYYNDYELLLPGTNEFNDIINKVIDYKKYFETLKIRKGSVVKLSGDPNDYLYGFNENMKDSLNSIQIIKEIFCDGGVEFKDEEMDSYSYGYTEIAQIIKY